MRDEFRDLISGWTLISGRAAISERLEEIAKWQVKNNILLEPDEEKIVKFMVECEIARGIEEGDFDF